MNAAKTRTLEVCVITGSRADYGLLQPVMAALKKDRAFRLRVIATAAHLAPEFGMTHREIEADGFAIDARVEMLLAGDTGVATAKSMGLGTIGIADALDLLAPDMVMLLGDRFEALAAAQAALVMGIPIAHLSGGDVTEGAFDDSIRHAISKMAHLHFTASKDAAARVVQMGESPRRVFAVGDPGLDSLRTFKPTSRGAIEKHLGFRFREKNLLVTFHPATLDKTPSESQFSNLLRSLDDLGEGVGLIFTRPNADPQGRRLIEMLDDFVTARGSAVACASLGRQRYLSVMALCDAVVGNSSSGLLEAPSMRKPTVNIGSRQDGRLKAESIIDCAPTVAGISRSIAKVLASRVGRVKNPYGDGRASQRIVRELKRIGDPGTLLKKKFHQP